MLFRSAQRTERDSLHLLIMDLHKELNQLQRQTATESLDGACVYGIQGGDRPLIAAFARGVNRTKGLKFDHPGLGTTATRTGDRLVIQNDIGLTEAHVLVVHLEPPKVTVTYTDVHLERVLFFQSLLARFAVRWEDTHSKRAPGLEEELKCAPETGRENSGAFRTCTHALAECFSLHWPSNSAGVKYPSEE